MISFPKSAYPTVFGKIFAEVVIIFGFFPSIFSIVFIALWTESSSSVFSKASFLFLLNSIPFPSVQYPIILPVSSFWASTGVIMKYFFIS